VLPAPNLDDRRFQDLVDEAKRMVQQRCPQWSDHNVSDPGVTLIEALASMFDQTLYRLNRVPDRLYIKFLDLLGVRLFPPTAARADVTFWLSAPQPETVNVPIGTEVATVRTETEEAISFMVQEALTIPPCSLSRLATSREGTRPVDRTDTIAAQTSFHCFGEKPEPGDALLVGLSVPVPSCAVLLRFDCPVQGTGVDPEHPPLAWEAWNGEKWLGCEVDRDQTGGFNKPGDVVLHVPRGHVFSSVGGQRAAWLRCRLLPTPPGEPTYTDSPRIDRITAFSIGGTSAVVNAETQSEEVIGISEGVPGQRFMLKRHPVVPSESQPVLEVSSGEGWEEWTAVDTFVASGEDDRHFFLDDDAGEIVLGPAVREADGSLRQYGAVPKAGSTLRISSYRSGGGRAGNVSNGAIKVLKSSVPYITSVENRQRAAGGVDGESVEEAKIRGPMLLRSRDRAVTAQDYEQLAQRAAPEVARVRCVPAESRQEAGGVRLLVVPSATHDWLGHLSFEQLVPAEETLERIASFLDERRVIGARILVEPPVYQGITVVARVRPRPRMNPQRLQTQALEALYRYFDPLRGGPYGNGWPFGRPIQVGEVYGVLQRLSGTEFVEDARLFPADPITGQRTEAVQRLELAAHALVFSYEHQVRTQ
jgi:predicted phage baseplate assembly protein